MCFSWYVYIKNWCYVHKSATYIQTANVQTLYGPELSGQFINKVCTKGMLTNCFYIGEVDAVLMIFSNPITIL